MNRPKPVTLDKVSVRAQRGPHKDGSGRWYYVADKRQGKRREVLWVGWCHPDTVGDVVMAELQRLKAGPYQRPTNVRTLHDLMDTWAASVQKRIAVKDVTKRNALGAAARLSGVIGGVLVERLTAADLEDHVNRCGYSLVTTRRDLKFFRQAWKWGRKVGAAPDREPPENPKLPKGEPTRSRYTPSREDVARLLADVRAHSEAAYRGLVLLAATGARPRGVVELSWGMVAQDCRSLVVDDKTGRRSVELHPEVAGEVARWRESASRAAVLDPHVPPEVGGDVRDTGDRAQPVADADRDRGMRQERGDADGVRQSGGAESRLWRGGALHRDEVGESVGPQAESRQTPTTTRPAVAAEAGHPDAHVRVVGLTPYTLWRHLHRASVRLGLPGTVTPTGMRRYVVDALYRSGAGVDAAASQLGHSPHTAIQHYRTVTARDRQEAVRRAGLGLPTVDGNIIELDERRKG